jgi:membrane protease YdiL (CAAX protease family)
MRDAFGAFLVGIVTSTAAYIMVDGDSVAETFGVVLPAQMVGLVGTVAWLGRRRDPWRQALRWSARWSDLVGVPVGFGIQVVLALLLATLIETFGLDTPGQEVLDTAASAASAGQWVLVVLGAVVLAPVAEEILFRGVMVRALEKRGRRFSVYASALLFSAAHAFDPGAWILLPSLFVVGVVLGYELLRTGRLGRAIAIHAGFNLLPVVGLIAGV